MARVYSPFGPFLYDHRPRQVAFAPEEEEETLLFIANAMPLHSRKEGVAPRRAVSARAEPLPRVARAGRGLHIDTSQRGVEGDAEEHRPVSPVQRLSILHRYQENVPAMPRSMTPSGESSKPPSRLQRLRYKSDNILFRDRSTIGQHELSMPPMTAHDLATRGVFNDEDYVNDTIPMASTYIDPALLAMTPLDQSPSMQADFEAKLARLRAQERQLMVQMWHQEWHTIRGPAPKWYELKSKQFNTELRKDRLGFGQLEDRFLGEFTDMRERIMAEHALHRQGLTL